MAALAQRWGSLAFLAALFIAHVPVQSLAAEFHAYYSRVDSGEPFEKFSRTGDYADIIVKLGAPEGRLVFWRGTSYLPYWETSKGKWSLDEIVPRRGDGTAAMPDRVNVYSHVEIIANTPSAIVMHWRYLASFTAGNPHGNVNPNNFVDEVFTVRPDGRVKRVVKNGAGKIDEWNDPLNQTTQELKLSADGVSEVKRRSPGHSTSQARVKGNPIKGPGAVAPVLWFKFDEGLGDEAKEEISRAVSLVPGHKTLWKKGVSGTAIQFDGYHTAVSIPSAKAPPLSGGSLTLEGWFALGAYPWNWAPIVQQGDDDGYFLGVDSHGYPGFMVKVDGTWQSLGVLGKPPYTDANHLALFKWHHVAGTYNKDDGMMRLHINGKEVASKPIGKGGVQTVNADVRAGKAGIFRTPTEATQNTNPSEFGIDGLIDEVKIYNVALSGAQIAGSFATYNPGPAIVAAPDMQKRSFPATTTGGKFKAVYTRLPYYETWDNLWRFGEYADVVVGFDQLPTKFVFWRGVSYIPMMVNESNQWFTQEFNETGFTDTAPGDCEPMSDKACRHSHVRIIENTDARVVIHWRYCLENPYYHWANYDENGWGDIVDWYYYIYPDGVASKLMRCYTSKPDTWYEWDEQMVVLGEGQHPESVINKKPVMTLVDITGKATEYDWNPNPPSPQFKGQVIQKIHLTGQYHPFAIQNFDNGDIYSGERTWYSVFPSWNHWPTAQVNSSGRNVSFPDRAAHSSISHLFWPFSAQQRGKVTFLEKILMEGMTDQPATSLVGLARSWLQAPPIEAVSDCRGPSYDLSQRAYVLCATGGSPSLRIAASVQHPIANLCFVVKNWNCEDAARLEIDSKPQHAGPAFRQGIVRDPNGRPALVVWLQMQSTAPVNFTLRGAKPQLAAGNPLPMTWATVPQTVTNTFDVTMAAAPLPGIGNEYLFERLEGNGHSSGWQSQPLYTDSGLSPSIEIAYRVKARDAYFAESAWSPVARVKTAAAPAPVVWNLDEGEGKTIKDSAGQHEGVIHGVATWVPGMAGKALHLDGKSYVQLNRAEDLRSNGSFTWMAWIRTTQGGTILARSGAGRQWQRGGKVMFVQNGRLRFDVGWVAAAGADVPVADGKWHHVAVVVSAQAESDNVQCFVDGRPSGSGRLDVAQHNEQGLPIRIGFCNDDFPVGQSGFVGDLDDVQWFGCALSPEGVSRICLQGEVK
jgi:hypothetical protein